MIKAEGEAIETIRRDESPRAEAEPRAVEKLTPEKVLDAARETAESVKNWAKETATKASNLLNFESAKAGVNKLLDDTNAQIEEAYQSLKKRANEAGFLSYADDFSSLPEGKREQILKGLEEGKEVLVNQNGILVSDRFFDFGANERYRIDRLPPEEQKRIREIRARGSINREAKIQADITRSEEVRRENERKAQAKRDEWRADERAKRATSERLARERAEKAEFEIISYGKYKEARFSDALEAQKELLRLRIKERKQGKPLEGEDLKRSVWLGLKAQGVDKDHSPTQGLGGEPTNEEVDRYRNMYKHPLGADYFRQMHQHWNKAKLSHDVLEELKSRGDPDFLEWFKVRQN